MKKALLDLGLEEFELEEPSMSKKNLLDKMKKQDKYESEVDIAFRQKFGIKDGSTLQDYHNKLKEKAAELGKQIDKIDLKEQKLMSQNKFEYAESVDYNYLFIYIFNYYFIFYCMNLLIKKILKVISMNLIKE